MFNTLKPNHTNMSERLVEISVEKKIRTAIKEVKGTMTYSQFLGKLLYQEK